MPHSAPRICPRAGCGELIRGPQRYCKEHMRSVVSRKPERIRGRALQVRNARLAVSNPLCVRCEARGRVSVVEEWDHVIPLYAGGADDESNLQGLCIPCHREKTRQDLEKYGAERAATHVPGWGRVGDF